MSEQPDIELTDRDGNVICRIYAGAKPIQVNRVGPDGCFTWRPADVRLAEFTMTKADES